MRFARKQPILNRGRGELRHPGFKGSVDYEIKGDPAALKLGRNTFQGGFTATPEIAEAAFRQGEAALVLESGREYRITMTGHSAGGDVAYFEIRI